MNVAGDDQRQRPDMGRLAGVGRNQRRLGAGRVEKFYDGQALEEGLPVDLQRRHQALRVQSPIFRPLLPAFEQVQGHAFIADALEVERDPHPVARRRAEIIEQARSGHGGAG